MKGGKTVKNVQIDPQRSETWTKKAKHNVEVEPFNHKHSAQDKAYLIIE